MWGPVESLEHDAARGPPRDARQREAWDLHDSYAHKHSCSMLSMWRRVTRAAGPGLATDPRTGTFRRPTPPRPRPTASPHTSYSSCCSSSSSSTSSTSYTRCTTSSSNPTTTTHRSCTIWSPFLSPASTHPQPT